MARYYFHLSRTNTLRPGQIMQLDHGKDALQGIESARARFLSEFLPEGLTRHGYEYLLSAKKDPPHTDSDGLIEIIAEFIRRDKYPYRPSRFQSFFAWRSMDDAMRFSREWALRLPVGTTAEYSYWEVEAEHATFESDMRLLRAGRYWLDLMIGLESYWKQEFSPDPLIEVLLAPPVTVVRQV